MSDTVAPMPADIAANLSPETRATYLAQMIAAGHKQADVEASLAQPVARGPINPDGKSYNSAAEADNAIAAARTAAQDKIRVSIQTHTSPPEGGKYDINLKDHAQSMDLNTLVRTASELRSAFSAAKIPAQLGQPLADALLSSERTVSGMNANQLAQWKVEQRVMLSRMPDGAEGQLKAAAIATAALPQATRNAWLKSGRLESMQVIIFLAHAGRALKANAKIQGQ